MGMCHHPDKECSNYLKNEKIQKLFSNIEFHLNFKLYKKIPQQAKLIRIVTIDYRSQILQNQIERDYLCLEILKDKVENPGHFMKGLMNMLISFTEKNSFKGEVVIEKPETRNKEILEQALFHISRTLIAFNNYLTEYKKQKCSTNKLDIFVVWQQKPQKMQMMEMMAITALKNAVNSIPENKRLDSKIQE